MKEIGIQWFGFFEALPRLRLLLFDAQNGAFHILTRSVNPIAPDAPSSCPPFLLSRAPTPPFPSPSSPPRPATSPPGRPFWRPALGAGGGGLGPGPQRLLTAPGGAPQGQGRGRRQPRIAALAMSDFDSNPFADPDLNNPFKVRHGPGGSSGDAARLRGGTGSAGGGRGEPPGELGPPCFILSSSAASV